LSISTLVIGFRPRKDWPDIQYIVVIGHQTTKGLILIDRPEKVLEMSEALDKNFEREMQNDFGVDKLSSDDDLIMEKILDNMNNTPLGQVLKKIACLPEVRRQKVLNVRHQLTEGQYDINARLDVALDKVLEQLIK
jgi:hypothetical protein